MRDEHYFYGGIDDGQLVRTAGCLPVLYIRQTVFINPGIGQVEDLDYSINNEAWEHAVLSNGKHVYVDPKLNLDRG